MKSPINVSTIDKSAYRKKRLNMLGAGIVSYGWIGFICITTLFPFLWMILNSFKPRSEQLLRKFLPVDWTLANYKELLSIFNFGRFYMNSIIVTVISVAGTLLFCSLAAYSLAKFKYRGNSVFFILILSTIMVPTEMLIIPWFTGIHQLKLANTYPGLIFPGLISAFGVFILRQAILNVPDEYIEAARIDGMSEPAIFFKIVLPLISGSLTALALITALNVWNDFLWPLIVVDKKAMYTIQVGIAYAADANATDLGTDWSIVMSATTIASVPMLLLVIAAQKYFVKGISLSGLKR